MGDFLIAYRKTIASEGLYSNDKEDSGGETVLGLTRATDKDWDGWQLVDSVKNTLIDLSVSNIRKALKAVQGQLDLMAQPYYKKKYWLPVRGDEISDQTTANSIYDLGVNSGPKQSIIIHQRAAGIKETGKMDDDTLTEINYK